jgi:hypothetical protein
MSGVATFRFADVPRYQRVLFVIFLTAITCTTAALVHLRHAEQRRLSADPADTQTVAPLPAATSSVQLLFANDHDDALRPSEQKLVLPDSPNAAARQILQTLLAQANPQHPLPGGPSVEDVFLLPLPPSLSSGDVDASGAQLAVVNLNGAFAHGHRSDLAAETLTLQSILATLHANFPKIEAARFLVDGQQSDTLAGHAELSSIYQTSAPFEAIVPVTPAHPRRSIAQSAKP